MQYDASSIESLLPHRYPFLLVDRIDVVQPGQRVIGTKRITSGDCGPGFGRGEAVPFAVVLEALAQTSGALVRDLLGDAASGSTAPRGAVAYFMGADRVRLRHAPRAGDELTLTVSLVQWRRGICRTHGVASVGDAIVMTADMTTVVR